MWFDEQTIWYFGAKMQCDIQNALRGNVVRLGDKCEWLKDDVLTWDSLVYDYKLKI